MDHEPPAPLTECSADMEGVRFSLKGLMLLTFLCAASAALVRELHLGGTVAIFVGALLVSLVIGQRCSGPTRRFWRQAIWGMLVPLACLVTDPFVFSETPGDLHFTLRKSLTPFSIGCYAFMAWQMAALAGSWFLTSRGRVWAALLAGQLLAGAIFAGAVGLVLLPLTVVFMGLLIGLPGLTPWFTMVVYAGAARRCWRVAVGDDDSRTSFRLVATGFVSAALIGLAAAAAAWDWTLDQGG